VRISVTKMKPDELILLQFCQRPPLYPRLPLRASVAQSSVETWGELDPAFGAWSPPVVNWEAYICVCIFHLVIVLVFRHVLHS